MMLTGLEHKQNLKT